MFNNYVYFKVHDRLVKSRNYDTLSDFNIRLRLFG